MAFNMQLLGSNGQYSRFPFSHFLSQMQTLGLTELDFVPQTPHFFCSHTGYQDPAPLRSRLGQLGMRIAALTPPSYRYSITAPEGVQRQATFDYYRHCLDLAHTFSCSRLVLGAAGACWDLPPEVLEEHAAQMLSRLSPLARQASITLLLTPTMGRETPLIAEAPVLNTASQLAQLLEQVNHPALGVCLDTNVMSVSGGTIPEWFSLLRDKTGLVRLCDGNYHGWRAWGEGCLPMDRYLELLEQAGYEGDLSLHLPGERYHETPVHPDCTALQALRGRCSS